MFELLEHICWVFKIGWKKSLQWVSSDGQTFQVSWINKRRGQVVTITTKTEPYHNLPKMIQILKIDDQGSVFQEPCPDAEQVGQSPFAIFPMDLEGVVGWRPIHIPSSTCVALKAWSHKHKAVEAIEKWYGSLDSDTQRLVGIKDQRVLAREAWKEITQMFQTADLEFREDE